VTGRAIIRRTIAEINDDRCVGWQRGWPSFVLALLPALLFLVALTAHLSIDNTLAELVTAPSAVAPPVIRASGPP
jgi:hypothetical protein